MTQTENQSQISSCMSFLGSSRALEAYRRLLTEPQEVGTKAEQRKAVFERITPRRRKEIAKEVAAKVAKGDSWQTAGAGYELSPDTIRKNAIKYGLHDVKIGKVERLRIQEKSDARMRKVLKLQEQGMRRVDARAQLNMTEDEFYRALERSRHAS